MIIYRLSMVLYILDVLTSCELSLMDFGKLSYLKVCYRNGISETHSYQQLGTFMKNKYPFTEKRINMQQNLILYVMFLFLFRHFFPMFMNCNVFLYFHLFRLTGSFFGADIDLLGKPKRNLGKSSQKNFMIDSTMVLFLIFGYLTVTTYFLGLTYSKKVIVLI